MPLGPGVLDMREMLELAKRIDFHLENAKNLQKSPSTLPIAKREMKNVESNLTEMTNRFIDNENNQIGATLLARPAFVLVMGQIHAKLIGMVDDEKSRQDNPHARNASLLSGAVKTLRDVFKLDQAADEEFFKKLKDALKENMKDFNEKREVTEKGDEHSNTKTPSPKPGKGKGHEDQEEKRKEQQDAAGASEQGAEALDPNPEDESSPKSRFSPTPKPR